MPTIISDNPLGQIGNTPLIRLSRLTDPRGAVVWGKMEGANPGGSVKDRIALAMIEQAEKDGCIHPGDTIVEPTSGNTGIGLSLVCAVKGYRLILTMPDSMSLERRRLLGAYGAELVLTPGHLGMRGAIEKAEEIARSLKCFMPQQFQNPANPRVHELTTGPEIVRALAGKVDAFVAAVGTGGTITGVGRALLAHNPACHDHRRRAGRLSRPVRRLSRARTRSRGSVPVLSPMSSTSRLPTRSSPSAIEQAIETARRLAREEGMLAGISSGAKSLPPCR